MNTALSKPGRGLSGEEDSYQKGLGRARQVKCNRIEKPILISPLPNHPSFTLDETDVPIRQPGLFRRSRCCLVAVIFCACEVALLKCPELAWEWARKGERKSADTRGGIEFDGYRI